MLGNTEGPSATTGAVTVIEDFFGNARVPALSILPQKEEVGVPADIIFLGRLVLNSERPAELPVKTERVTLEGPIF